MPGAVHDLLPVVGKEWTAVIPRLERESLEVRSIDTHGVDVEIPILERREDNRFPVGRKGAFGCVDPVVGEPLQTGAVRIRRINVVRVETPNVPFRGIRFWRAGRVGSV